MVAAIILLTKRAGGQRVEAPRTGIHTVPVILRSEGLTRPGE